MAPDTHPASAEFSFDGTMLRQSNGESVGAFTLLDGQSGEFRMPDGPPLRFELRGPFSQNFDFRLTQSSRPIADSYYLWREGHSLNIDGYPPLGALDDEIPQFVGTDGTVVEIRPEAQGTGYTVRATYPAERLMAAVVLALLHFMFHSRQGIYRS